VGDQYWSSSNNRQSTPNGRTSEGGCAGEVSESMARGGGGGWMGWDGMDSERVLTIGGMI